MNRGFIVKFGLICGRCGFQCDPGSTAYYVDKRIFCPPCASRETAWGPLPDLGQVLRRIEHRIASRQTLHLTHGDGYILLRAFGRGALPPTPYECELLKVGLARAEAEPWTPKLAPPLSEEA